MAWTYARIRKTEAGWQVPAILRDGNIRYFEDALTALHYAEYKAGIFNNIPSNMSKGVRKVPILDSQFYTTSSPTNVYIGDKAQRRMGLPLGGGHMNAGGRRNEYQFKVVNAVVLERSTSAPASPRSGAQELIECRGFGQVVFMGHVAYVMTSELVPNSDHVPEGARWTNVGVNDHKRVYDFPVNTFVPVGEREYDFLSATPPPPPTPPPLKSFSDSLVGFKDSEYYKKLTDISDATWETSIVMPEPYWSMATGSIGGMDSDLRDSIIRYSPSYEVGLSSPAREVVQFGTGYTRWSNDDPYRVSEEYNPEQEAQHHFDMTDAENRVADELGNAAEMNAATRLGYIEVPPRPIQYTAEVGDDGWATLTIPAFRDDTPEQALRLPLVVDRPEFEILQRQEFPPEHTTVTLDEDGNITGITITTERRSNGTLLARSVDFDGTVTEVYGNTDET